MAREPEPFLGRRVSRAEALANVPDFEIVISETGFASPIDRRGKSARSDRSKVTRYTRQTVVPHHHCSNPQCRRGGVDIQQLLFVHELTDLHWAGCCSGDEGTPAGRRRGNPCENAFSVSLTWAKNSGERRKKSAHTDRTLEAMRRATEEVQQRNPDALAGRFHRPSKPGGQ